MLAHTENITVNKALDIYDAIAEIMVAKDDTWRNRAACRGSNAHGESRMFFPVRSSTSDDAKAVCARCPVIHECRHDWEKLPPAMQHHGIWFGTTNKDRERMRRKRIPRPVGVTVTVVSIHKQG